MEDQKEMNEEKVSVVKKVFTFIKKVNFFQILILLVVVGIGALGYKYRGEIIVATVNGKPVTRYELVKELEKQGATQALDSIIIQKLIAEKAMEKNIEISNETIASEIKTIKESLTAQGMELDQALQAQGMTMESLVMQIKLQKELEKLVEGTVAVTDEQVNQYVIDNVAAFAEGMSEDAKKVQAKEDLTKQQLSAGIYTYVDSLKTDAKINYLKKY